MSTTHGGVIMPCRFWLRSLNRAICSAKAGGPLRAACMLTLTAVGLGCPLLGEILQSSVGPRPASHQRAFIPDLGWHARTSVKDAGMRAARIAMQVPAVPNRECSSPLSNVPPGDGRMRVTFWSAVHKYGCKRILACTSCQAINNRRALA